MIEISGYLTGFASSLKAKEGLLRVVNVGVTSSVAVVGSIVHNKSTQCVNEVREEQAALEKDKKLSSKPELEFSWASDCKSR